MFIYPYDSHASFQKPGLAWRFELQMFSKDIPGDQTFVGERECRKPRQEMVKERTGQTTKPLSTGTQVIKIKTITHIHRAGQHIFYRTREMHNSLEAVI